jgi:hypothetical protein
MFLFFSLFLKKIQFGLVPGGCITVSEGGGGVLAQHCGRVCQHQL